MKICTLVMIMTQQVEMDAVQSARLKEVTIVKEEIEIIEIIVMKLAEMDSIWIHFQVIVMTEISILVMDAATNA